MQYSEQQFAENAAVLTYVFNNVGNESFKNLLTNEIIKLKSLNDLKKFYMAIAEERLKSGDQLPELPTLKDLIKSYSERAVILAKLSKNNSLNKFVNPITLKVMTAPKRNRSIGKVIEQEITNYYTNKKSLPKLFDSNDEWKLFCQKKIMKTANELTEGSKDHSFEKVKTTPPANYTVAENGDNQDEFMEYEDNSNSVRQTLFPKITSQAKLYDVIKMRDYVRIMRRLWILARLHNGKEKEILRIRLDSPDHQIFHPYFKNIDSNLYKRIFENMGINKIHEFKTTERK